MNEVSPKQGMLLAPGWMRKDASQIVPPRSSDPMTEGPLCRIRREARARGAVAALVSENLNAVDFNRPNRDARLFRVCCKVRFLKVESKSGCKDSKGLRMPTSSK